jgi:hypothetical protein
MPGSAISINVVTKAAVRTAFPIVRMFLAPLRRLQRETAAVVVGIPKNGTPS